jgi:serine/threonine protein kinase
MSDPSSVLVNRQVIAQGGYGPVFAALLNLVPVAVKVVDLALIHDHELKEEVRKETMQEIDIMKLCSERNVRNVVRLNEAYQLDNQIWASFFFFSMFWWICR